MCRHLAYLGPEITLAALLLDPPHSLEHQSHAPRHQIHSTVNADGFGVAWYAPDVQPEPARYRTTKPMWADRSFASIGRVVRSPAILAAARSATPPLPIDESANAPFLDGRWAGSLNGFAEGYRGPVGTALRRLVPDDRVARMETNNDAETILAVAFARIAEGNDPTCAVSSTALDTMAISPGPKNLLLTDGTTIVATAWGNSLFTLADAGLARDGVIVASEPLDDHPAWERVEEESVVTATVESVSIHTIAAATGSNR